MESNKDVRHAIREAKLKQWQVADMYGLSEGNFSRMLRKELSSKKKEEIFRAIKKAKNEIAK
ncbi:hypothetical protein [Priestia megaterium]|uniref:hypothetical protein n=1 Tax=Priestia megaterium TaxID=1404 RepID=UPI002FFF15CF